MDQLDNLMKQLDIKESEGLVNRLYEKINDKYIFADTPFRSPNWSEGYTDEKFDEDYRYRKQFEEHFHFWEQIMAYAYL